MVYCGKPSKGCGECRSRKIRCDQVKPTCSQCIRANRVCPGYRDQLSLLFRNESQEVVRKARAARSSGKQNRSTRRRRPAGNYAKALPTANLSADSNNQLLEYCPLVQQPISISVKDQATCLFFSSYAWIGGYFLARTDLHYSQMAEASVSDKAVLASVSSIGMAALAGIKNSPSLKLAARSEYVSALRYTNAALADATQATSDATLTSVVLLSQFEILTSRVPKNIDNWTNHVRGATTLLELRGLRQLDSELGLRMFTQLRNTILISCIQRQAHVPSTISEFSERAALLRSDAHSYMDRLAAILIKLSNLRADISAKYNVDDVEILSAAQAIESELTTWAITLPQKWAYRTFEVAERDSVPAANKAGLYPYDGRYHIYADFSISDAWNNYRASSIIASEIILGQLHCLSTQSATLSFSGEYRVRCRSIGATQRQLALDICYSVPFHLGLVDAEEVQSLRPLGSVGGFILLYPLFVAACVYGTAHPVGKWVIDCYKLIRRTNGTEEALALVDILNGRLTSEGRDWAQEDPDIVEQSNVNEGKVEEVTEVPTDGNGY